MRVVKEKWHTDGKLTASEIRHLIESFNPPDIVIPAHNPMSL